MSYDSLSEPIRKFVRDKGWDQLRPIQNVAISKILNTEANYILAARTASGKTEAAFLPILSKVDFREPGVRVLYISPLKALINDQFYRVEELCKYLDVSITKWHGDANRSLKKKLVKNPNGIVLITPESIEAMFVNRPHEVRHLFSNLEFVVVDEIHSFIGTDRGTQLKSLLFRLQSVCTNKFRVIGLSATLGDYLEPKKFTGDELNTKILLDREPKDVSASFRFFDGSIQDLPLDLLKDLYSETKENKALIFPNSRGRVEEIAVKLKKISKRVGGHTNYFSHHSSVDKDVREYVEFFAKNSQRENFCISCTSTLELGIDIGSLDKVVQVDSTHSIASLIQRMGRSGRKESQGSNLILYATDEWQLLQSLACYLLHEEGFIEPPRIIAKPFDILLHQALSITKERSGIDQKDLISQLRRNSAFSEIEVTEIEEIIEYLISIDFLEKLGREVIIGIEGENVVNSRDFYTVFETPAEFSVSNKGSKIGSISYSRRVRVDENIFLAARIWKIVEIDFEAMNVEVIIANDGRRPEFSGGNGDVHPRIRERMFEILMDSTDCDLLSDASKEELRKLRKLFSKFTIKNQLTERPVLINERVLTLFTFTGSRINRTLSFLFNVAGFGPWRHGPGSSFEFELSKSELLSKWDSLGEHLLKIDVHINDVLKKLPGAFNPSKYAQFLPIDYKVKLIKQWYFDLSGTSDFLKTIKFVENRELPN